MENSLLTNIVYDISLLFILLSIFSFVYLFIGIIKSIFKRTTEKECNKLIFTAILFDLCLSGLGLFGFVGSIENQNGIVLFGLIYTINILICVLFLTKWRKKIKLIDKKIWLLKILFSILGIFTWISLMILLYFYDNCVRTTTKNLNIVTPESQSSQTLNKSIILPRKVNPKFRNEASSKNVIKTRDLPREYLCDLIRSYGTIILDDPRKGNAILNDYFGGEFKKERNSLVTALNEGIPQELLKSENIVPNNILFDRFKKRLMDNYGVNEELAFWAVESWALALRENSDI
jgi:hypothetical protein